jgi:transposase
MNFRQLWKKYLPKKNKEIMLSSMKALTLTEAQTNELRRAHRAAKNKKDGDKRKAVYLLSRGKTPSKIAEVLMLDVDTIGNYRKRYELEGVSGLLKSNYLGSEPMLNCAEMKELTAHLEVHTYLTVETIVAYVKQMYDVHYSISGMRQLLHRLTFVYKKAKTIPGKANTELQKAYLETLAEVLKNKGEHGAHYYLDGVHPQHNTQLAYDWIKKGQDKVVKSNAGRQRININGVLNADTLEVVVRTDDMINGQSTLALFKTLEQKHPNANSIFITLDNARYYKNAFINEYLATSKIKLLFMPPYSPNLNLIERLWKFMRRTILYNKYYEKFADFRAEVMRFFENIGQYNDKLSNIVDQKLSDYWRVETENSLALGIFDFFLSKIGLLGL